MSIILLGSGFLLILLGGAAHESDMVLSGGVPCFGALIIEGIIHEIKKYIKK